MKLKVFLLILFVLLVALPVTGYFYLKMDMPKGEVGAKADALAKKMQQATNVSAWNKIGYISWNFANRVDHQWDRERQFVQVNWKSKKQKFEVRMALYERKKGITLVDGKKPKQKIREKMLQFAFARWANDSYWLNPIAKVFDAGVTRSYVKHKDGEGLLVSYAKGGVTPGDSYLYLIGKDGLPIRWHMWVKILPIGGLGVNFGGWKNYLGTKLSTIHQFTKISPLKLKLTKIKAAKTWSKLLKKDPFSDLVALLTGAKVTTSQPTKKTADTKAPKAREKQEKAAPTNDPAKTKKDQSQPSTAKPTTNKDASKTKDNKGKK